MKRRRSRQEVEQLIKNFEGGRKTRTEYCRETGLALSTLGRHLKRRRKRAQRLVRVRLESERQQTVGFALVLGNGRRIESDWKFGDAELARLIRIVERV